MAARLAAQIASKNKGRPVGRKKRRLERRSTYVGFLKTHNPQGLECVVAELENNKRKRSAQEKALHKSSAKDISISPAHRQFVTRCIKVRDSRGFKWFITAMIFVASALVGMQTYTFHSYGVNVLLHVLDQIILWVFVVEVVVKMASEGKYPWVYFWDAWNSFDFVIVTASFLPLSGGQAMAVFRLLRLLRLLKLVKALPKLQILVIGLLKSLSSIVYIGMLMTLQFFLFAVVAVTMFGENDPDHLGNLHVAFLTLFRCSTLEDWTDVMYISMYGCAQYGYGPDHPRCTNSKAGGVGAAAFWIAFILLSTYMIINLFIGVITTSMNEAKEELGNVEKEINAEATEEDLKDMKLQDYMHSRLIQIQEIVHTIFEEFQELAVQEKERVSDVEIFLRSNRNSHLHDGEIATASSPGRNDSSQRRRRGIHNKTELGSALSNRSVVHE